MLEIKREIASVRRCQPFAAAVAVALAAGASVADARAAGGQAQVEAADAEVADRLPMDEVIYFALPDRVENGDPTNDKGGGAGGHLDHGHEPTMKGFYHGGDLAGLTRRLDYVAKLGATAIWLGPIYRNKPVQGPQGAESAGYHGYWITDFLAVDPHFGTDEDMAAFVEAAHARGMKVYLDIITNHTADVIAYRECHDPDYAGEDRPVDGCPYRGKGPYPFSTRGGVDGAAINPGFMGDGPPFQTPENFSKLRRADAAYTPYVPTGEETAKNPGWLNDPVYYHNRGDTNWQGESVTYGDFAGLDDLATEHPDVVSGMIDIYKAWITKFRIDGFRIDTAKHVNPEFWQAFVPAILEHAESLGIRHFYVFGEAYHEEPAYLARHTRVDGFPAVLDFGFQRAVKRVVAEGEPALRLDEFFAIDDLYAEGAAAQAPVFIGNHDMGRFARFVRDAKPGVSDAEALAKVRLAHAMMFFLRGAPVIYYGDEQGFVGDGWDQDAREDMFPSRVASYNDNDLLGSDASTAASNFDTTHPLFREIRRMSDAIKAHPALRRGRQVTRLAEADGGAFAASRLDPSGAGELLVAFNASDAPRALTVEVDYRSTRWRAAIGNCPRRSTAAGAIELALPAWGYAVCASNEWNAER
ncbi:MAG: alpha-amylase [Alphaproteobacteria bacterium]|nr:alpha-amylase [Alphaproteobacteria bacterium]